MNSLNQKGRPYQYVAASSPSDHGALPREAAAHLGSIEKEINRQWREGDDKARKRLLEIIGCINRLSSFLLQVSRVATEATKLGSDPLAATNIRAAPEAGMAIAITADRLCTDFESLLFHARAALDRLTVMMTSEHGQRTDRFSRLRKVLQANPSSPLAKKSLSLLDQCTGLSGVLIELDSQRPLRSKVIHNTSIADGARNAFTVHYVDRDRLLLFDCESLNYPVLSTARSLGKEVPFLVQNVVAAHLNWRGLKLSRFEPEWENPSLVFTEFLDSGEKGPQFSLVRMDPDGLQIETRHLRPEIISFARKVS